MKFYNPFTFSEEKFHKACKELNEDSTSADFAKAFDKFETEVIGPILNAPPGDHEAIANLIKRIWK